MASAYELMLVLRGRNYLSNDLRRAGADLRRMQTMSGLQSQRSQLQINRQRLASTKAIAQEELRSITTGTRRLALNKAIEATSVAQANALQNVRRIEEALDRTQAARLRNNANLSRLTRQVQTGRPARGFTIEETRNLQQAARIQQQQLASQAATQQRQLEIARQAQAASLISTQQLAEREADLAHRQEILTDKINTTTAAEARNTEALNENALAMRRLPLEQLGARARYVEHLGRSFQTMGLFATAALGYAAHAASQFNTQITLASTQATLVGNRTAAIVQQNARQIQNQIQSILSSGNAVAKPGDLTQGLYSIYSGITLQGNQREQIQQGINILKQFQRVYTANFGQVEFNDVVRAGIALINSFNLNAKSLPGVLNRMQASVRFGALTMSDFVGSLNQVVPAYKSAHLTFNDLAADVATVSRLFPNLRYGTTGLARLLEQLGKTQTIQGIQQQLGVNIAPGGRLQPLLQIIQELAKADPVLTKGGVAAQNFFKQVSNQQGTIQARRVFAQLISSIGLYRTVSGQVIGDNKELQKSFTDMSQTPQVRWAEFTNQLRGLVLEIGTDAIPVFTKLADPIRNLIHWFDNLSPHTKKLVSEIATWGAVSGLTAGTLLVLIGAVGRTYAAIRLLLLGRAGVAALEGGFVTASVALRASFIGALILLMPLIIKYHTQIGHVIDQLGGLKSVILTVTAAFVALKFANYAAGFSLIGSSAVAAAGEVGILAAALNAIPAVVATTILVHEITDKKSVLHKAIDDSVAQAPGLPVYKNGKWVDPVNGKPVADQAYWNKQFKNRFGGGLVPVTGETPYQYAPLKRTHTQGNAADLNAKLAHAAGMVTPPKLLHVANFDVNAAIANVEALRRAAEKSPTLANWTAYERAYTALQKHYTGYQLTALNDYLNSIESAESKSNKKRLSETKKAAKAQADAVKAAQKEVTQAAQTLQNQYQSIYQSNQTAFGQIFSGPFINSPRMQNELQYGHKITGRDLLTDIKSQVSQFRQWRTALSQLRKKGIVGDLYEQIVAAGPSALPEIRALLSLSPADIRSYTRTFNRGQNLIAGATQQDMNLSLLRYRKYGQNIALQIIQGLRDEHTPVLKVFEDMILKDFPGLAKEAKGLAAKTTHGRVRDKTVPAGTPHTGHTKPKTKVERSLQSVTYNLNTKPTDVSTALRKAKKHHQTFYGDK